MITITEEDLKKIDAITIEDSTNDERISEYEIKRNEIKSKEFLHSILDESADINKGLKTFDSKEKLKLMIFASEECDFLLTKGTEKFGYDTARDKYIATHKMTIKLLDILISDEDIQVSFLARMIKDAI